MTTGSDLYRRAWRITVGTPGANGKQWTDIDCRFSVKKTASSTPNDIDLTLYNLAPDTRGLFEKRKTAMMIEAGYDGRLVKIASGEILRASSTLEGVDWETKVEAADGMTAYGAVISETLAPDTTEEAAVRAIAKKLGLPVKSISGLDGKKYGNGRVLSGPARFQLDSICKTRGLRWSIQDGYLVVFPIGATASANPTADAVLLTPSTGMIGSPEKTDRGYKVRSLMQGQIVPGMPVKIKSRAVDGVFLAETVEHSGDTDGNDWYTDITAVKVT
jgi:hypothetical protein